jgi:hypothetical protein
LGVCKNLPGEWYALLTPAPTVVFNSRVYT